MTQKMETIPFGRHCFIKDASVIAGSGLIYKNQIVYHFGDYDSQLELLNEEVSGFFKNADKIVMGGSIDAPIYPLNLTHSSNYFHLLIEHLPRFIKLKSDGVISRDTIIVLGQQHKNLLDAFFLANNNENRLTVLPYANGLSSHTVIGTSGSFQQLELKDKTMPSKASVCRDSLTFARHYFWEKLGLAKTRSKLGRGKKLFVLRQSGQRNLLNIIELACLAREHNFELLRPELLTLQEQAQVFSNAEVVIGPTGAWLANMIFARPKTIIHVLFPSTSETKTSVWKRLGDIFGISVIDHYSKITELNEFQPIHSDFTFNVEEFTSLLKQ
jgi:capsular polysaccharide biosynthesis protein